MCAVAVEIAGFDAKSEADVLPGNPPFSWKANLTKSGSADAMCAHKILGMRLTRWRGPDGGGTEYEILVLVCVT